MRREGGVIPSAAPRTLPPVVEASEVPTITFHGAGRQLGFPREALEESFHGRHERLALPTARGRGVEQGREGLAQKFEEQGAHGGGEVPPIAAAEGQQERALP